MATGSTNDGEHGDDEQPPATCGQGLAASASLPGTLGQLMSAMAEVLASHQQALDLTDDDSRREHQAYQQLCTELTAAASQLAAVGQQMLAHRSLPMGRHDEQAMATPAARAVFQNFVQRESALLQLLQKRLAEDEEMLKQWG